LSKIRNSRGVQRRYAGPETVSAVQQARQVWSGVTTEN
jgi:hypothetical protein